MWGSAVSPMVAAADDEADLDGMDAGIDDDDLDEDLEDDEDFDDDDEDDEDFDEDDDDLIDLDDEYDDGDEDDRPHPGRFDD